MKIAFVFWWVSLAQPQPNANLNINDRWVDSNGVRQERVRYFDTEEQCKAVQEQAEKLHENDFILISACGGDHNVGLYMRRLSPDQMMTPQK